jgi:hypothetical protein
MQIINFFVNNIGKSGNQGVAEAPQAKPSMPFFGS